MYQDSDLKLIYVLKIGYNANNEGLYEFIFSSDQTNIEYEDWLWDMSPACDNAEPPHKDFVDSIFSLKTKSFDLVCLHESVERSYMHGYHNIIALAYEDIDGECEGVPEEDGFNQYEDMFEEQEEPPVLIFHYGITLEKVKELLYERKIIFKGNEFVESSSVELE